MWLLYGATIRKSDLYNYALQQAVVESIVERGTYAVGGSQVPRFNAAGDTFPLGGRMLPAKQPGQFTIGAPVYFICARLGLTYAKDYFLAAAVVTWFTASLLSAASVSFFYLLVTRVWGYSRWIGIGSALSAGLGTILFPYSGVAHHDVIAAALLLMAFHCAERSRKGAPATGGGLAAAAGALIGAALFTSMLPVVFAAGLIVHILLERRRAIIAPALSGLLAGLAPLFIYNIHYFGNPFVQANIAGKYSDTFAGFDLDRLASHLNIYFGGGDVSVLKYMPVVVLGAIGLFLFDRMFLRQKVLLAAVCALHLIYVLNIPAFGYCQYGPRFLIPAASFVMLGLPGYLAWASRRSHAWLWLALAGVISAFSLTVNLAGALEGTMFCDTWKYAFVEYLRALPSISLTEFPLARICVPLLALMCAIMLPAWLLKRARR